jgi:hypothetical protein
MKLPLSGLIAVSCMAQQAVPAAREPHHHVIYEDARVRILDVRIEPRGTTLLHRHDTDYVGVTLDEASPGIRFSAGGMTQVELSENDREFREVIIELLQPQTGPRNVCGEILLGQYLHCHDPGSEWLGANLQMQFETDQTRFGILQIAPNAKLAVPPADVPPLLIALEGTEAEAVSRANRASAGSFPRRTLKAADVLRSPADQVTEIQNNGKTAARFLIVEFGGPGE